VVTTRGLKMQGVAWLAVSAVGLSACGGSNAGSSSGGGGKADVAAAKQLLAPYTGKPSAFPVDQPLKQKLPAGSPVGFLQCVTPICGLIGQLTAGATQAMGVKLAVAKADASATSLQGAMATLITQKPKAILLPAVEPDSVNTQLKDAANQGIPVTSDGIMNHERYGIAGAMFNTATATLAGKLLAAKVVADKGAQADVAFYLTPELSFGKYIQQGLQSELATLCPGCKLRTITVPVATIGNSAPSRVVSDLQTNSKTNIVMFSTLEAAVGLPAAMKTAGLSQEVTGFGPNPANLQDLKAGSINSAVGIDFPVMVWTQLDEAVRAATKQPLTAGEAAGIPPLQILTTQDVKFDPSKGYTGYPDFAQRFAKLWGAAVSK